MDFYSHPPNYSLKKHLSEVSEMMKNLYYNNINFGNYSISSLIEKIGLMHDFGKYTTYFQNYLFGRFNGKEKNHSILSALFAYNCNSLTVASDYERFLLYYIIRLHHSDLITPSTDALFKSLTNEYEMILNAQKNDIFTNKCQIENETNIKISDKYFTIKKEELKNLSFDLEDEENIQNYFMINYLFSLLIEADKLHASKTKVYERKNIASNLVDLHIKKLSFNIKRIEAKKEIESALTNIDINKTKLFSLTAPTGLGKTLSSLNFAIKLKEKIESDRNFKIQIIYCLPYINIIEQVADEFEKVFKDQEIRIIKHHTYSNALSLTKTISTAEEYYEYNNYEMLMETWQGDIVITTFVQFLHTLISNKNKLIKKFNHLAGSIVILDEVQTIDCKYWPLIGALLFYLTEFLDTKIIVMTATQPHLFNNLSKLQVSTPINPVELLKNNTDYFSKLTRTKIVPVFNDEYKDSDFINFFKDKYSQGESALIVLNTIKRSKNVFNLFYSEYDEQVKKGDLQLFYLSTSVVPQQRLIIIKKIRKLLRNKVPLILIATQCVEAGVDLDFDIGFRDLGPLDSIIQVAGRINRNGHKQEYSPLYVVDFDKDCRAVYGPTLQKVAKEVLSEYLQSEICENNYQNLINKYFSILNNEAISQDVSIKFFDAMKSLKYSDSQDLAISNFNLIEERANYVDVYIAFSMKNDAFIKNYHNALKNNPEYVIKNKKKFYSRVISVKRDLLGEEIQEIVENLFYIPSKLTNVYYDINTGFGNI